jgi:hypothetical protein
LSSRDVAGGVRHIKKEGEATGVENGVCPGADDGFGVEAVVEGLENGGIGAVVEGEEGVDEEVVGNKGVDFNEEVGEGDSGVDEVELEQDGDGGEAVLGFSEGVEACKFNNSGGVVGVAGGNKKGGAAKAGEEGGRGRGAFYIVNRGKVRGVRGAKRVDVVVGPGALSIYQQTCVSVGEAGGQGGRLGEAGERDKEREFGNV